MMARPINVLQLISSTGVYGAERWVLALARHLDRREVSCSLATPDEPGQCVALRDRFNELGLRSWKCRMRAKLDPTVILGVVRLIRREKIDIVHTHGYKSDIIGLCAARAAGARCVATPHGFENARDRKLQFYIRLGCATLRWFDAVAPLSEELASDVLSLGVPAAKVHLIRNGVDLDEIEATLGANGATEMSHAGTQCVAYVGQMIDRKNLPDLLRAFDLLHSRRRSVRLILVGDGPRRADLEDLALSLPSSQSITFTGYRPDRLRLLRAADLFSMTSSLEGIPRCMMEAMALRIPVAAYDIPGVDQLVLHERTGLLARFGDVDGLCRCFERILADKELAATLAEEGRRHVEELFSARRMASEFRELYGRLVAS